MKLPKDPFCLDAAYAAAEALDAAYAAAEAFDAAQCAGLPEPSAEELDAEPEGLDHWNKIAGDRK